MHQPEKVRARLQAVDETLAAPHATARSDRDDALYTESGHMPDWAENDVRAYWDAADLYERSNGRLYVAGDFALPRGVSAVDQVELARDFVADAHGSREPAVHVCHPRRSQSRRARA